MRHKQAVKEACAAAAWSRHASIIESLGNWPFTEQVVRARRSATVHAAVLLALVVLAVVLLSGTSSSSPSSSFSICFTFRAHCCCCCIACHCSCGRCCCPWSLRLPLQRYSVRIGQTGCSMAASSASAASAAAPSAIILSPCLTLHTNTQTRKLRDLERYRRRQVRTKMLLSAICCLQQCSLMGTVCNRPKWWWCGASTRRQPNRFEFDSPPIISIYLCLQHCSIALLFSSSSAAVHCRSKQACPKERERGCTEEMAKLRHTFI